MALLLAGSVLLDGLDARALMVVVVGREVISLLLKYSFVCTALLTPGGVCSVFF